MASAAVAGKQINLDEGEGQVQEGRISDDIRLPCCALTIKFDCDNKLNFSNDNQCYFTYKDYDWIPIVNNETFTSHNTWHYEIIAHPKQCFQYITKPAENTMMLARAMNLQLTEESSSLELRCPIINYYSAPLIQEYRRQYLNLAYINGKMGDAYFIYFDSKNMYSVTWRQLVNQKALSLQDYSFMQGQNVVSFIDDQIQEYFQSNFGAKYLTQVDYLKRMFGKKIQIRTATPGYFARMYTIKFTDNDALDQTESFLCVRTEQDINEGAGFINTFAQVNYISGEE